MSDRALSFGGVADTYDRLRPRPPLDVVRWLVPDPSARVLDLGAGTGIMTRQLLKTGHHVVAVEPDDRMRVVLAQRSPAVTALAGTAEEIPLDAAAVDAVVVSSAWHWMNPERAVPEIARVLRPGGSFGVVWNRRDFDVEWYRDLVYAAAPSERRHERLRQQRRLDLPDGSPFGPVEEMSRDFAMTMTAEELATSISTYSDVAVQEPDTVVRIVDHARQLLADRFGAGASLEVPMRAVAFRTTRT